MSPKGKPFSAKDAAARASGLAPQNLLNEMAPGAVFSLKDELVVFPSERAHNAGPRTPHATRRVIIVQATEWNRRRVPSTVLVVPCSASTSAGPADVAIPHSEPGFTAAAVAFPSLTQPMLKSELATFHGLISTATLARLQAALASLIGVRQEPVFAGASATTSDVPAQSSPPAAMDVSEVDK